MVKLCIKTEFQNTNSALSRISTRRKNIEAEEFPAVLLTDRIVAAEKCRAANSRNTFYFSRPEIFPPSGDPALVIERERHHTGLDEVFHHKKLSFQGIF